MTLFCPRGHLLLRRHGEKYELLTTCEVCGWQAPASTDAAGETVWATELDAPLGGPTRHVYAVPAIHQGRLFLPLANGEMVALEMNTGRMVWRTTTGAPHRLIRTFAVVQERLLALVADTRDFGSEHALAAVEPASGEIHTLWRSDGMLVGLLPQENGVVTRAPDRVLHLVPRDKTWAPAWEARIPFWPLPPVAAGEQVLAIVLNVRQERGEVWAVDKANGTVHWRQEIPKPLLRGKTGLRGAFTGQAVVFAGGHARAIWALEPASGQTLWQHKAAVYTTPLWHASKVWMMVRGPKPSGALGHYLLIGLDSATGERVAEVSLPHRVRLPLHAFGRLVLAFDEVGQVLAVDTEEGVVRWQTAVGSEEDPPGATMVSAGGMLAVGTFSGKVAALRVGDEGASPEVDPEALLAQGQPEAAAETWALHGEILRAAEVYEQNLQKPQQALALLEFGGFLNEALAVARRHQRFAEAERLAIELKDLPAQAEMREAQGDLLTAARLWEKVETPEALAHAAALYEQTGAGSEAWRLRKALGQVDWLEQLAMKFGFQPSIEDLETYAREEGFLQAARLAMEKELYEQAVDFYRRAGDTKGEREALECYLRQAEETGNLTEWAWRRLAEVAEQLGDLRRAAQAWEGAGEEDKAANLYFQIARKEDRQEGLSRTHERQVAHLYLQFLRLMGVEEEQILDPNVDFLSDERLNFARERVLALKRLPRLEIVKVTAKENFREKEFNELIIAIANSGYGRAKEIRVLIGEEGDERFEVDATGSATTWRVMLPRAQGQWSVYVKPREGAVGKVPLVIRWEWRDAQRVYRMKRSFPVKVIRSMERYVGSTAGTVVIYQGNVTRVEGDYVGGQKGDRVVVQRGNLSETASGELQNGSRVVVQSAATFSSDEKSALAEGMTADVPAERRCPWCGAALPRGELSFCPKCGKALPERGHE